MKSRILIALLVLLLPAVAFAGNSQFLNGNFGQVGFEKADLDGAMTGIAADYLGAAGEFQNYRTGESELGSHVRFQQYINGMAVIGAQTVMHVDARGNVFAINGEVADGASAVAPKLAAADAMAMALGQARIPNKAFGDVELGYVLNAKGGATLAWHATVSYGDQLDRVFADAATGELVARHPLHHFARVLRTYDCNNGTSCGSLWSSSSNKVTSGGDLALRSAHNYAIDTYDLFSSRYGRDSLDDNGMTLRSRVHYQNNYNNAFWDGTQMTYGDGDGTTFVPLSQDADVVAHELTHGVTSNSSNLIYQNESGALNEAWSDIFGSEVDRYTGDTGAAIWLIGEDIYTPGTAGDALRDMADPVSQGDYDYYPTRYTGSQDNGGVHWNSGIANLAYKLLVDGGTHPRGKTSVNVSGIGHLAAASIFYNANNNCLTASSNFQAARNCTGTFAGSNAANVTAAWDAVGVPGGGGTPPPPPPPPPGGSCTDNNIWTGTASTSSANLVTPSCSNSGTFNGVLECQSGGSADLDLYLEKESCGWGCSWGTAASSTSAGCAESVSGYSGTSGNYRWRINHYSGPAETFRLCTNKC